MKSNTFLGSLLALIPATLAQQSVWGQCGGINWTGPTTCVAGSYCQHLNDWYWQCVPGTSSTSSSSTSTTKTSSISTTKSSTSSAPTTSGTANSKFWFSFGDSYTQTGFTVTGTQPSTSNAFGNPTYPGYTACGSYPNWIDYAAVTLNSTFVKVFNHAYGGAMIDASLVTPYTSTVLSLVDQTNNFLNYNAPGKSYYPGWSSSNSLFSVWIGINDIGNSFWGQPLTFDDTLLNRYFVLMQNLYAVGARHFLFLTVPPVYRSPLMLAQSTDARNKEKTMIDDFNTKLAAKATAFAAANSGVTTRIYDTGPIINAMLNSPSIYGLRDATSYGTGSQYAWCNDYHISPTVHNQIAKGVAALIKGTYI
ncbi:hypothetical protein CPB86DRAFT_875328 [Serendipita vermifera]|nr:hypothetical protein CPB86DRAFT_875328 [Serendipita vermifera]